MEGSDDHYLFVNPDWTCWAIWSSLKAEKFYIESGSAGQACPAHPRNASHLEDETKEWSFNKADDNDVDSEDLEEGGVVLHCSVHTK